jgi:predicted esterase
MTEHFVPVTRTARYYTLGKLTENTKNIWIALHGYGQLAKYFIQKFEPLNNDHTFIIAPEGISRFYIDDKYQRMGASWMTREMKDDEIDEYVDFLNQVVEKALQGVDTTGMKFNFMGFSQGCATVCRWLNHADLSVNRLVLWAGFFSNGIEDLIDPAKLKEVESYYIYGEKDEFLLYQPEILPKMKANLEKHLNPTFIAFDGGHSVKEDIVKTLWGDE